MMARRYVASRSTSFTEGMTDEAFKPGNHQGSKSAQTAHRSDPKRSASREAMRDPKFSDAEKTGSGVAPDDQGDPQSE